VRPAAGRRREREDDNKASPAQVRSIYYSPLERERKEKERERELSAATRKAERDSQHETKGKETERTGSQINLESVDSPTQHKQSERETSSNQNSKFQNPKSRILEGERSALLSTTYRQPTN